MTKSIKEFSTVTEIVTCDFCGSEHHQQLFNKMRHGLDLQTVICLKCGLVFTNPMPTDANLNEFYEKYYHTFHKRQGINDQYINKSNIAAIMRLELLFKVINQEKSYRILEIGSGAGSFLKLLTKNTFLDIKGIEVGTESYNYCKLKNLPVENIALEMFNTNKTYNVICSFHVLEHLRSPKLFFSKVNSMLTGDGILYLEVPNLARPGGVLKSFLQYPHLYSFTFETIFNFGVSSGFYPVYMKNAQRNLTVIFKKISKTMDFEQHIKLDFDIELFIKRLNRVNRIFQRLDLLPNLKFIQKIKNGVTNYISI